MSVIGETVVGVISKVFDRIIPDPVKAGEMKLELLKLDQAGELESLKADVQLALGQIETNKVEAASESLFVSGWRPFVGWTCGVAFAFKYVGGPLLAMICQALGYTVTLPAIDAAELTPILGGMLGLGAMRSWDKWKATR